MLGEQGLYEVPEDERQQIVEEFGEFTPMVDDEGLRALRQATNLCALLVEFIGADLACLPECYRGRYDAQFLRQFHGSVKEVGKVLVTSGSYRYCRTTAEELAAHWIIQEASKASSFDFDKLHTLGFEDHDVLMLFGDMSDYAQNCRYLMFEDWFAPFGSLEAKTAAPKGGAA